MIIDFQGILMDIDGDPATDGEKTFAITDDFWEKWNEDKGLCKVYGFFIEKRGSEFIGIYRPYAIYAEGTKRLRAQNCPTYGISF